VVVVVLPMRMATVRNWRSWWYRPIRVAGHHSYSSPGSGGECSCDEWKMPPYGCAGEQRLRFERKRERRRRTEEISGRWYSLSMDAAATVGAGLRSTENRTMRNRTATWLRASLPMAVEGREAYTTVALAERVGVRCSATIS